MLSKVVATLALVALVACSDDPDVLVLGESNFDDTLASNELVMVEFYAPWCGHCKKLAPEYAQAATELKSIEGLVVGKVDATVEQSLGEKFEVRGYPTIKIFRGTDVSEYEGGRTAKDIVSYLKKQMGPAVKELASADDVTAFIPTEEKADPVVVAYAAAGSDLDSMFRGLAKKKRDDYTFGVVNDASLFGDNADKIVLYKPFDDLKNVFDGEVTESAVIEFLQGNSVRLVDEIGPDNYKMYVDRGLPIMWMFYDPGQTDSFDAALAEYKLVAPKFRQVSFVYLDGVQYSQMVTKMALSGNKLPAIAIENTKGDHFVFDESKDITADGLTAWLEDYTSGTLKANIRSEAVPASNPDEDGVTVVVGTTFDEIVMNKDKDVLIEFYAPWCGHCKKLIPVYGELAQRTKGNDGLVIAKMDSTVNDATGIQVQGFPTIKFVRAGDNEVMDYNGARTTEGFLDFLKAQAKNSFTVAEAAKDEL